MTEKKAGEETPSGGSRRPSAKTTKRGAKAKKADVKRDISHDLIPIAEETWLLQPIAVTMMRHDYSQVQVRILVSIVESLQNILQGMLNGGTSRQLDIFRSDELDEDGRMPIKMPFKELGVSPSHYPQLRNSLKMLASIPVEIPYKTQEGRKYTKATNLCDVYIPEDNSYSKYAILKIDRTVAERLVSFDFGYHRLGKQIVFACKNRYTQRIYMFIASWLDKGKAVIDPLEFRKMLRLEKNYKKFPDFCRRVLDRYVGDMLVRHFAFNGEDAARLAARITPETYQAAVQKLMDLLERFKTMAVKDRAAYTYRAMDELIRSRETVEADAEEVGDKKEEKEDEKVDGKEAAKPKARTAKTGEKQATDEKVEKITNN